MAGWGVSGPYKYGTAAHRATLTAADVRLYEPFFETDTGKLYHVSTVSPIAWAPGHIQQYPIVEVGPSGATRRNWGPLTLAQAQALGTSVGAAVGDVAWDTTNKRPIYCLTASSTSTWGYKKPATYSFAANLSNAGTISFVGWYFRDGRLSTIAWDNVLVLPHDGIVVGMGIYSDSANPGSTTFGLHLGAAGADPSAAPSASSGTLAYSATDQLKTWAPAFAVTGGQKLAASCTPTNSMGTFQGYVEIDYTVGL